MVPAQNILQETDKEVVELSESLKQVSKKDSPSFSKLGRIKWIQRVASDTKTDKAKINSITPDV